MRPEPARSERREAHRSALLIGICLGIGLVGALDEIVLHQLLQWHNVYVHTSASGRIFADGLFHAFTTGLILFGVWLFWRNRALLTAGRGPSPWAGILLGMGGFNLYDGIIQHKILGLHPVREGVATQLPYDLVFIGIAVALLAAGLIVWRQAGADAAAR